nr:unnamed protein product [Callosobruchus chinensis]
MAMKSINWRDDILLQLQDRNQKQTKSYQDLIVQHNRLFENYNTLYSENLHLNILNEKLKSEGRQLEQKLLAQAEELAELHKRKGENAQQIIDLNVALQEKDRQIATRDVSLADSSAKIISLQAEVEMLTKSNKELKYSTIR